MKKKVVHLFLKKMLPSSTRSLLNLSVKEFSKAQKKWFHIQNSYKIKRVCVGMSGGVDSTVAAHLLKSKGYEVIGVFMKNWDIADETGTCRADKDADDAEYICKHLQIPFHYSDFVKEYWHEVFTTLLSEIQEGWTPNPDVECNKHIKFGHFYKYCMENIGCNAVATGHYARSSFGDFLEYYDNNRRAKLLIAMDRIKDQTLFLSQIPQEALRNTMFPIGNITKDVVKEISSIIGLEKIAQKRESMGICFIGKRKSGFANFLQEYIQPSPGPFIDIETYKEVGTHQGVQFYTNGQGAKIPSVRKPKRAWYVVEKDVSNNRLYVCQGYDHPSLFSDSFHTDNPYWIDRAPEALLNRSKDQTLSCKYRSQNTKPLSSATISYGMRSTNNWEFIDREFFDCKFG